MIVSASLYSSEYERMFHAEADAAADGTEMGEPRIWFELTTHDSDVLRCPVPLWWFTDAEVSEFTDRLFQAVPAARRDAEWDDAEAKADGDREGR